MSYFWVFGCHEPKYSNLVARKITQWHKIPRALGVVFQLSPTLISRDRVRIRRIKTNVEGIDIEFVEEFACNTIITAFGEVHTAL